MTHKTAKEIVTTRNAVDRARRWCGEHRLNGLTQLRRDALVCVEHQYIITGGISLRALALDARTLPVGVGIDFCTRCAGNVRRVVFTAGVEQDNFVSPGNGGQAIRSQVGSVFGDQNDRQAR